VAPTTPTASVGLGVVAQGQVQSGVGSGFQPGETVTAEMHSTPLFIGTRIADANGQVSFAWTVPAGTPVGEHQFVLTGDVSGTASATFNVVAAALPATGSNTTSPAIVIGLLLTLAGGTISLLTMRRAHR
jgi:LPXTG-motif cell wall-anchored protein